MGGQRQHNFSTVSLQKELGSTGGVTLRRLGGKDAKDGSSNARIVVTRVDPQSVAAMSGLKVEQQVISINNVDCSLLSEASARDVLLQAEVVTFLVQPVKKVLGLVTALMTKGEALKAGIILEKNDDGQVCVGADVHKKGKGLASISSLKPGMRILSVNNVDCTGLSSSKVALLFTTQNLDGMLSILAQQEGSLSMKEEKGGYAAAVVDRRSNSAPLGLELFNSFNAVDWSKRILIKNIAKESIFFGTGLRVGMEIVSIGNIECTYASGATARAVMNVLQDTTEGNVTTVVAKQCHNRLPGSLFTVVLTKESVQDKLGLGISLEGGQTTVSTLKNGSIASLSKLEVGMQVLSINNLACGEEHKLASKIIAEVQGEVVFLVQTPGPKTYKVPASQMVTAAMIKNDKNDKVGCALAAQGEDLVISKIYHGTLADFTDLKVGMKVHKINNADCSKMNMAEATRLMARTTGSLTILAEKAQLPPGRYVAASITCADSLGMRIAQTDSKTMPYVITKITDGGLASQTDLQPGMLLKSINNVDCISKHTLPELTAMLATKVRPLNILAVTPGTTAVRHTKLITTMVPIMKGSIQEGSLDLDEVTGIITVSELGAKGFLYGTPLRVGMEIVSMNNVPAKQFSTKSLSTYLNAQDFLLIVARKQDLQRGVLMTEVLYRPSVSMPLGIGIKEVRGKIYISSIRDATLASTSKLMPGMEILSIDNEECRGMGKHEFARVSRETVGDVVVVATTQVKSVFDEKIDPSLVTATFDKANLNAKVGLTLAQKDNKLAITKISGDSLAADSELMIGMELMSINNEDVSGMSIEDATGRFAASRGILTVLVKRPSMAPGSFITATIVKDSPTDSVGIRLGVTKSGLVAVKEIVPLSLSSFTDLEQGMIIEAVNGVNCSTKSLKEMNALFAGGAPVVTILAQTTKDLAVGRASFKSTRSLMSSRSLASRRSSESSHVSGSDPAMHRVAPSKAAAPKRRSVPQLIAPEQRDEM